MNEFSCSHVREGFAAVATIVATLNDPESVWHSATNEPLEIQRTRVDCKVQMCLLCIAHARHTLDGYASDPPAHVSNLPPAMVRAWAHGEEPAPIGIEPVYYSSADAQALIRSARVYRIEGQDCVRVWTTHHVEGHGRVWTAERYAGELILEAGLGHTLVTWLGLRQRPVRSTARPVTIEGDEP